MQQAVLVSVQVGEVMGPFALSASELARRCGVELAWVVERVETGVLEVVSADVDPAASAGAGAGAGAGASVGASVGDVANGSWRFDSVTLVRARRLVALEKTFDADPQLAALTADLIEEVARLKRRLVALGLD